VRAATMRWGQQWPPAPAPNVPPPPGPVSILRASSYTLLVSSDGHTCHTVASVNGRTTGTVDVLHFAPVRARSVQLRITASTGGQPPMRDELSLCSSFAGGRVSS
jgi:hypothetical protein